MLHFGIERIVGKDILTFVFSFIIFVLCFFLKPNRVWGFYNLISTLGNLRSFIF
jgi:hypothetical protein